MEFGAQERVVVRFVEVNDSKSMELRVPGFLFDHGIDDVGPTIETIAMFGGIRYHSMLSHPVIKAGIFCCGVSLWVSVWMNAMRL